ncbi:MAG: NHLP bacteriocin export ABC transporter permease/ATPase subunit [Acidobacteriota bacterium]
MAGDETIPLPANAPLLLNEAGVWIVESGSADVFAVPPDGVRNHLLTVGPGQILCGTDANGHRPGLLAVGSAGTRVRRLDPDAVSPELLDAWLSGLFGGISKSAPPRVFDELKPGSEIHLEEAGRVVRAPGGVAWVRHLEGESRFLGEDSLALRDGISMAAMAPMPVPEGAWLVSAGEARIAASSTPDFLRNGGLLEGLDRFHDLCLACVELQLERAAKQERERLEKKEDLDRATLQGAYARLSSVLEPQARGGAALAETSDPLLAVCRMVGQAQGIVIRSRPESGARQGDLLTRICEASRVRARRIILREDWWRRDNGPLVGFRTVEGDPKAKEPVALLPTSARSYELIDPVAGTRAPVDAAVAETLSGDGFMFYPPLPERLVKKSDLLAMALRDRRDDLGTILLMGFCGGLLALLVPILTGQVFGNVIPSADRGQLAQIAMALVVAALASAAFQVTRSIAVLRLGGKLDGTVQSAVWDRLLALPVSFFRRYTVGDLASRSMGIDAIRDMLTGNVLTSVLAAVFSLFSFALLFYYSWRLALLGTALVTVLAGVTALLTWLQLRHQRALLAAQGKMSSLVFGLINGISKLRVAGAEARAYARWAEGFAEQRRRTLAAQRVANVQASFNPVYSLATSMAIFAVAGFSSGSSLPLGEFLAFNAAFGQFLAAVLTMIGVLSSVLAMVPVYERLSPILETVPEVDESKAEPGELAGEIEFGHVSFRYQPDGPLILDDVSFRAKPGEFIALVGPSGAGKSTCLRMILGFEKPSSGSIYYDGQDVASLAVRSVRRQIGVVLQSGRPMAGSIVSNILGSSNLGIDAAWEAARLAGLEDDIKAMPMGMHTVISEGAETFSGGQKQRMLIARALVNRPRIILFDEATSALDNRTQDIVSRSLERLKATRIVIAHRLSTIQNADRIYVMEGGRVVEEGSYDELIRLGGTFARLAERQIA